MSTETERGYLFALQYQCYGDLPSVRRASSSSAEVAQQLTGFTAQLQGSFQLNSPLTDNRDIDVATSDALYVDLTLDGSFDDSETPQYGEPLSPSSPEFPDCSLAACLK